MGVSHRRSGTLLRWSAFLVLAIACWPLVARAQADYPRVRPGAALKFPRDHGSHPQFRTEWWYITGWLKTADGRDMGMQVTFFRSRPRLAEDSGSRFAPRQLLVAHAALSRPEAGRLLGDQRAARAGFGLAEAAEGRMDIAIEDWSLKATDSGYAAEVVAREFRYALRFEARQPPFLQGDHGFSRKGPGPAQASYYYSLPQLVVKGSVVVENRAVEVTGEAWLDHEWSSEYLAEDAVGWDWIGINLADGGALMAFRVRGRDGGTFWAGGSLRAADGRVRPLRPREVKFIPLRHWRSPRSGAAYPVALRVEAGPLALDLEPLIDDQELDSRASTGAIYWEGAVRARQGEQAFGRGYLELTGYWKPLRF